MLDIVENAVGEAPATFTVGPNEPVILFPDAP
jgi:hypothetical protein